ncbi:MAG TPA: redoxin domain-containing protein [Bryobacteraceae bacterium]|jgi:cytochrome c biogenesis protein CcmG/thiol:disulfide interchange protein DsbE
METGSDPKTGSWVDDRMASLNTDAGNADAARGWSLLQQQRRKAAARRTRWTWSLSAAAAAAAVVVLGFPLTRAFAARCVSACVELASSLHTSLPSTTRAEHGRKLAPDFTLADANGKAVKLSDYRGQVVLLNFWATWCQPCQREIPWFIEFQQQYRPHGFAVLGVSLDEDGWNSVKPYIEAKKTNYPVMIGNDALGALYGGIVDLPTTLLIDKSGHIAVMHVGLCSRSDYEGEIKGLLVE